MPQRVQNSLSFGTELKNIKKNIYIFYILQVDKNIFFLQRLKFKECNTELTDKKWEMAPENSSQFTPCVFLRKPAPCIGCQLAPSTGKGWQEGS